MTWDSRDPLASLLDWFGTIEGYIPGARTQLGELLLGKVPQASAVEVYELARAWEAASRSLADAERDARRFADAIFELWRGDGVPTQVREEWRRYLEALNQTVAGMATLGQGVRAFGQEIELLKFMVVLNVALLASLLFTLIVTAGAAMGGVAPAIAAARKAIAAAAARAITAISSIFQRGAITGLVELITRTLPRLAPRQLAQLAQLAQTGARQLTRSAITELAASVLPRQVIARSVADRMAARWFQTMASKAVVRELEQVAGREAGTLLAGAVGTMRQRIAAEIETQLLRKFAGATASEIAAHGAATTIFRATGMGSAAQVTRASLSQYAAEQIARTSFSRELTRYLGTRAAFGAGYLGGGNLLGQSLQLAAGHRSSIDGVQVLAQTVQGGVFGVGMWGGLTGHVIGGGVAGGLIGTGNELVNLVNTGRFNVWNIAENAAHGATVGGVFGAVGTANRLLNVVQVPGLRIGQDAALLLGDRGGVGILAHDHAANVRLMTADGRGVGWHKLDAHGRTESAGYIDGAGQLRSLYRPGAAEGPSVQTGPKAPAGGEGAGHAVAARPDEVAGRQAPTTPVLPRNAETSPAPEAPTLRETASGRPDSVNQGGRVPGTSAVPSGEAVATRPSGTGTGAGTGAGAGAGAGAGFEASARLESRGGGVAAGPHAPAATEHSGPLGRAAESTATTAPHAPEPPGGRPDGASPAGGTGGILVERTVGGGGYEPFGAAQSPASGPMVETGAVIRPRDYFAAEEWAAEAYRRFRQNDADIVDMARHLDDLPRRDGRVGFTAEELAQIKKHLMIEEHLLDSYLSEDGSESGLVRRRFDPDPGIAEAWIRLSEGRAQEPDIILLEHELVELRYLRDHPGATYREAHQHANQMFNWERIMPGRSGEDLDTSWGQEGSGGHTDRLPEGSGGQSGGRVPVRSDGPDGPTPGDRQGVPGRQTGRRESGRPLPPGAVEDPSLRPGQEDLAGEGHVRGVAVRLRVVVFDGEGPGGALHRLVEALRAHGDEVLVRTPRELLRAGESGEGISVAEPIPGAADRLSPLLRVDGLPRGADVVVGYRDTVGIAERHRATYPDATIVQIVDEVPRHPSMLAHLERANLVVPLNSETAAGLRRTWEGRRRVPVLHEVADLGAEVPATAAAWIRQTVHGLGDRVPVSEEAWRQTISPRDILAAQAERDAWKKELASENLGRDVADVDPALGQLRVMTVCTEYESRMGGIPTVNKLLTEALANAGAQAYARVALVRSDVPQILSSHRPSGIRIRGVWSVPTGTDYPVLADARALSILPDNLPARVNVLIGHSRFGGGAAKVLQESYYPDATRIHVLHTAPEILDAIRGDPAQGSTHAQTERDLIVGAQVVSGVGPLLTREVGRLAPEGHGNQPPIVHQIIPDMPGRRINPSPLPPGGRNFVVGVQGRAGDPIKRLELAAHVVRELNRQGMPTRLVVRGAPSLTEARAQAAALTEIAESSVTVRTYSTNREQLNHDLFEADLMLMPSIHEGFGMVAAEAAQSGVPVLVGEGTGAGLFFGDPALVDPTLGESAIVRDGNTVESLADALGSAGVRAERPYAERMELASQVRDAIDDSRLPFWVSRAAAILDDIEYHRERAVALRDYLDRTYPTGRLARDLLNALRRVRGD